MSDEQVHNVPIEDSIDLHPFAPRDIKSVVEEYINAAHEAGFREVRLIHGRGKGIQHGIVQQGRFLRIIHIQRAVYIHFQ